MSLLLNLLRTSFLSALGMLEMGFAREAIEKGSGEREPSHKN